MKRALVVEINDKHMIVIDNKGRFKKVKNKMNLKIGDEYERNEGLIMKKGIVFAMSLILLLGIGGFGYSYAAPKDYLTLDINPSIKLTTNRYSKVIKIEALNSDGESISKELKIKNKNVNEAIKLLVESAVDNGYMVDDENAVMLTSTSDELLDEAEIGAEEGLEEEEIKNTEIIKENVNKERFEEAERLGISPGKVNLIQKLQQVMPEATLDEYANSSVKDIMKKIKEQRVKEKEENKKESGKTKTNDDVKETTNSNGKGSTYQENKKNNENPINKNNNSNANKEKINNGEKIKENIKDTNNSKKIKDDTKGTNNGEKIKDNTKDTNSSEKIKESTKETNNDKSNNSNKGKSNKIENSKENNNKSENNNLSKKNN